jgi:hypothetical protein
VYDIETFCTYQLILAVPCLYHCVLLSTNNRYIAKPNTLIHVGFRVVQPKLRAMLADILAIKAGNQNRQ